MLNLDRETINMAKDWALTSGLRVVGVIIAAIIIRKVAHVFIRNFIRRTIFISGHESKAAEKKRENTLIEVVNGTLSVVIFSVAVLIILQEFGIEIGPILAAAGVAGLAIGFGGQYLIKDIVSGLFIILENQYGVGDVVCFGSTCGLVEDITLRMTSLRDQDGRVYHVPHGEIKTVANLTKDFSRVNLNITLSYDSNMEKVIEIVNYVGQELAEDPKWKEFIIKPPQFLRVDNFADSGIVIKILGDTLPIMQWDVTGELRKRLKMAFDREGIKIALPQIVIREAKS